MSKPKPDSMPTTRPVSRWTVGPFTVTRNGRDPDGITVALPGHAPHHYRAEAFDRLAAIVDELRGPRLGRIVTSEEIH